MDRLAAMQVFVRVVETGGLSAAGRALGLAPSSVSRRIGELEDVLGVRLLQRTTRRLSLTEAGESYYERSRDILRAVDEATQSVSERRAGPTGVLRLTAPTSIASRHIAPAVADFQKRFPAVGIAMSVNDRLVDIVGEGFDLALRLGRLEDSSFIARKICETRRVVCASPEYLKRAGRPDRPEHLADHACLTFRRHPGANPWRFRADGKKKTVRVTGPFFADDGETLVAAACSGLGIVLLPEWLVGPEIDAGRLTEILTDTPTDPPRTPLHALYAPNPYVAPKVRAFVDFLVDRFAQNYAGRQQD